MYMFDYLTDYHNSCGC